MDIVIGEGANVMNWEREVLKEMIGLLIDKTTEWSSLYDKLYVLGIDLNIESQGYDVLRELTGWEFLSENLEAYTDNTEDITKEDLIEWCMEHIKEKQNKGIK